MRAYSFLPVDLARASLATPPAEHCDHSSRVTRQPDINILCQHVHMPKQATEAHANGQSDCTGRSLAPPPNHLPGSTHHRRSPPGDPTRPSWSPSKRASRNDALCVLQPLGFRTLSVHAVASNAVDSTAVVVGTSRASG